MRMPTIDFKRGDTVMLSCSAKDEAGDPVDLTNIEVRAQVRNPETKALVSDFEVEWVQRAQGTFLLWADANKPSSAWPLGDLHMDIEYAIPGTRELVLSTETIRLNMIEDVTK